MTIEGTITQRWNDSTNGHTSLQFDEDDEYMLNVRDSLTHSRG
jgi:hypothetical protein